MTAKTNPIISQETLSKQTDDLSEDQRLALQEEATNRFFKKKEGSDDLEDKDEDDKEEIQEEDDKEETETQDDDDKEEKEESDESETPEEKAAREKKEQDDADEALLKKPEEELSAEEKTRKQTLVKAKQDHEFEESAKSLALEKKISVDEAKKELKTYAAIVEKYKGNPLEMGKALVHSQREFLKLQTEHKKLRELPNPNDLQPGEAIIDGKRYSAEETRKILIDSYRRDNPKLAEDMDDEKVYQLAAKSLKERQSALLDSAQKELAANAKDKRVNVLATLTDAEGEYAADIKSLIEKTPDAVIMNEDWDFEEVKAWARGRYYTPEKIDELRKESFNKGKEEAKILGLKEKETKPGSSGKPPVKSTVASTLTQEQKEQALDMYRTPGLSDEDKYKMYADYLKHQKKVDKDKGRT